MVREILAKFGVQFDTKPLEHGHDQINATVEGLKHLAHAVAGVFAFHQIEKFVEQVGEEAAQLRKASKQLGLNVQDLENFQFAAGQAGVGADALNMSLRFLERNAYEAGKKSSEAGKYFKSLGIEVKGANGKVKPATELMLEAADAFKQIEDPSERTAAAMRLFGRSGYEMVPMLELGSEKLREYMGEVEHLGGGFSDAFHKASGEFRKHHKAIGMLKRSIKDQLALQAIPALMHVGHAAEKMGLAFIKANKNGEMMRLAMSAFAFMALSRLPQIVAVLKHMNWQLYLAAAKLLAVFILLEDIVTWLRGGESVIGDFFGSFAPGVNEAAAQLGQFFSFITSSWDNLVKALSVIPSAIGMALTVAGNELANGLVWMISWVQDQWDKLIRSMHLPSWAQDLLGTSNVSDTSGKGNQRQAEADAQQSREQIGKRFLATTEGSDSWKAFTGAMAAKQTADQNQAGWDKSKGQAGEFRWDMVSNAPTRAQAQVPAAIVKPTTQINDSSKTEVHVEVHGATPANVAHKTATETARAVRNQHNATRHALEHVKE